jgi:hypothetical protein
VAEVITAARQRLAQLGPQADDTLETQFAYFEHRPDKRLYQTHGAQGLFYGSGVIEGGCGSVVGRRLKESGMSWTEVGATSVLTLRMALKSLRWDECWDAPHDSNHFKIRLAA